MNLINKIIRRFFGRYYKSRLPYFDDFDDVMRWLQDPNTDLSNIDLEKLMTRIEQRMAEQEAEENKGANEISDPGTTNSVVDNHSSKEEKKNSVYCLGIEFTRFGTRIAVSVDGIASLLPGGEMLGDGEVRKLLDSLNNSAIPVGEMPMMKFLNRVIARADEFVTDKRLSGLIVLVPPSLSVRQTNSLALCLREIAPKSSRVARACTFSAAQYSMESFESDRGNVISCCFDEAGVNLSDIIFMAPTEENGAFFEETCTANLEELSPGQILWRVTSLVLKKVLDTDVMARPGMLEKVMRWASLEAEQIMLTPLSELIDKEIELDPDLFFQKRPIYVYKSEIGDLVADSANRLKSVFEQWKTSLNFYREDKIIELLVFDKGFEYPIVEDIIKEAADEAFSGHRLFYRLGLSPDTGVLYAARYFDEIMRQEPEGNPPLLIDANWQDLILKISEFEPFSFNLPLKQRPYRYSADIFPEKVWQSEIALCFYQKGITKSNSLIAAYQFPLNGEDHLTVELDIDSVGYVDIRIVDREGKTIQHLELEKCDLTKVENHVKSMLTMYPVGKLEGDRVSTGPLARKERLVQLGLDEDEYDHEDDELYFEDEE